MAKINFNAKKLLPVLGGVLTLAGVVVNNVIDSNNRNDLKNETVKEATAEVLKQLKGQE